MRSGPGLVATVCALALFPVQSSQAASSWLPATDLSATGTNADKPDVSVDSEGNVLAIWSFGSGMQSADRPVSGPFALPEDLAPSGSFADQARVALNSRGDAVALFREFNGANSIAYGTYRRVGTPWELPVPFSPPGQDVQLLRVAIGPAGEAMAAWNRGGLVQVTFRPGPTGAWELPISPSSTSGPGMAFDSVGNAIAVWANDGTQHIQAAFRAAGAAGWAPPVDVSAAGQAVSDPAVAFDASGNALATFIRGGVVQAAKRSPGPGGTWQAPVDLSAGGEAVNGAMYPEVALAPGGQAVVVWDGTFSALPFRARAAYRPSLNAAFEAPVDLSIPGQPAFEPRVDMDARGNAVAIWHRFNGSNYIVQGSVKPSGGGAWSSPENLSAAGQTADIPRLAVDPQGNAIAVWDRSNGTNQIAQLAAYDGAGPLLRSLSVPSAGAPSQTLAFSVAPVDVWSAVGPTSWTFGDGTGADGTNATHSYGATGSYEVTVTSSDVLGNTTSATRTVVVSVPGTPARAPVVSSASLTNKRFRVGKKATPISARLRRGTTFRFTLSAPATLTISITGSARGLRRGRRCVKPTAKLRRSGAKRCKRRLRGGRLTRTRLPARRGSLRFSGRIGRRALAPGSYRAVLRARNAAGSSRGVTLRFVVAR